MLEKGIKNPHDFASFTHSVCLLNSDRISKQRLNILHGDFPFPEIIVVVGVIQRRAAIVRVFFSIERIIRTLHSFPW